MSKVAPFSRVFVTVWVLRVAPAPPDHAFEVVTGEAGAEVRDVDLAVG
jgi:hypothetical protein